MLTSQSTRRREAAGICREISRRIRGECAMQLAGDAGILRNPRIQRHRLRALDIFDQSNLPRGNDDISRVIADPTARGTVYPRRSSRDIIYIFCNLPCSEVLGTKARAPRIFERNRYRAFGQRGSRKTEYDKITENYCSASCTSFRTYFRYLSSI